MNQKNPSKPQVTIELMYYTFPYFSSALKLKRKLHIENMYLKPINLDYLLLGLFPEGNMIPTVQGGEPSEFFQVLPSNKESRQRDNWVQFQLFVWKLFSSLLTRFDTFLFLSDALSSLCSVQVQPCLSECLLPSFLWIILDSKLICFTCHEQRRFSLPTGGNDGADLGKNWSSSENQLWGQSSPILASALCLFSTVLESLPNISKGLSIHNLYWRENLENSQMIVRGVVGSWWSICQRC